MTAYGPSNSECVVYVYRAGIASAVGHDLAIEVQEFTIDVDDDEPSVEARFEPDSLRVRYATDGGEPRPGKLSRRDKKKIEKNIRREVLETRRFPVITFRSTDVSRRSSGVHVQGVLDLHGVERAVAFEGTIEQGATVAEVRLEQPDFDIEPYRALLGALKLKPHVDVRLRLPFVPPSS